MGELKVGDRVEYTGEWSQCPSAMGKRGSVVEVNSYGNPRIKWENYANPTFAVWSSKNLKKISEIEVGDRVRYTKSNVAHSPAFGFAGLVTELHEEESEWAWANVKWDNGSTSRTAPFIKNLERIGVNEVGSGGAASESEESAISAFKKRVAEKALSMAGQNWCEQGVRDALTELGIPVPSKWGSEPLAGTISYCEGELYGFIRGNFSFEPSWRIYVDEGRKSEWTWKQVTDYFEKRGFTKKHLKIQRIAG